MVLSEQDKTRLNELRLKEHKTDAEDQEFQTLKNRDIREEVPVGTTTQKAEMIEQEQSESGSQSPSPSSEQEEEDEAMEGKKTK